MWLLKPKPPRSKRVCKFCAGPFGMAKPHDPFCSAYCAALAEDKKRFPIDLPDSGADLLEALKYP